MDLDLIERLLSSLVGDNRAGSGGVLGRILPLGDGGGGSGAAGMGGLLRLLTGNSSAGSDTPAGIASHSLSIGSAALGPIGALGYLGSLFRGDEPTPAPRPVRYTAAPALFPEVGFQSSSGVAGAFDFDQVGTPRVSSAARQVKEGATPIVIQVQTIDSRSFLDHSNEIASAVRQALLNSHPLGDVLAE
jgi:hypothetical protein